MKYKALLRMLRALVYVKRFFWFLGAGMAFVLGKFGRPLWKTIAYFRYKLGYFIKNSGRVTQSREWFLKRDFLQIVIFLVFLLVALPQTRVLAKKDTTLSGQKTVAYRLIGGDEDYDIQEVIADTNPSLANTPSWRSGAIAPDAAAGNPGGTAYEPDFMAIVAGGNAILKPTLMPGAAVNETRSQVVAYQVVPGDSLGSIANDYGISVATVLWENNLTARSIIRPGDILKIPPASGVMYTIKKGDTLKRIATTLGAKSDDIIIFNKLKSDGSDLKIGERIMIPGGVKPTERAVARVTVRTTPTISRRAAPPGSSANPSASGFVWPSGARMVTQYFSWKHHAVDIAGPWQTATYAAKAGVVEKAQCGWNSGYGCYVIIDHGGGVKTLYGHHSQLLVSPGEEVSAGQTIALMGNTGHVRGITGIHLHFEVIVNGARVNPLGYIR